MNKKEFCEITAEAYMEQKTNKWMGNPIIVYDINYKEFSAQSSVTPLDDNQVIVQELEQDCFEPYPDDVYSNVEELTEALMNFPEMWKQVIETIEEFEEELEEDYEIKYKEFYKE